MTRPPAIVRPRRGDLEKATEPHPFQPSGEYVGNGQTKERCDLCGLVQRGTYVHPEWPPANKSSTSSNAEISTATSTPSPLSERTK